MSRHALGPFAPDEHKVALYRFDEGQGTRPTTPAEIPR